MRWLFSKTVRHASAMCKHVEKLLNHQRDILTPQAVAEVESAIASVRNAIKSDADKAELEKQMTALEASAEKWLKPYPNATYRENVEVLLVALAVAMGIRTFFLQPFKIPTGSMQPTLFGVTSVPDFTAAAYRGDDSGILEQSKLRDDLKIPTGWERIKEWFQGVSYIHLVADHDGELEAVGQPVGIKIFNFKQTIRFGGENYTIWFPPDYGQPTLDQRAGLHYGQFFHKGEDIIKMRVGAGDHLFVDRLTYNFRTPRRGEIIVFATKGIDDLPQDQFYIKRLVALPGEKVQIGDDRHLIINGKRLDASTPHFQNLYSFDPNQPPHESQFSGHVNQKILESVQPWMRARPEIFTDASTSYTVSKDHLMVMGDNTMNSLDSRYWGDFPAGNVIGRAFGVYWPLTGRFGFDCLKH
jgi:signal peptidase I